jgi:hypothetical protein
VVKVQPDIARNKNADESRDTQECTSSSKQALIDKLREMYPAPAKQQSPRLLKVQQMKIKTKAKGDPKRIKSVDDRFFFNSSLCPHSMIGHPFRKDLCTTP